MFRRLLIANRGEIACRIIRTCRRLGIATVAVYSEADRDARHVRLADAAVALGPAPASASYLRIDRILEAARRTGCEAVHPGYGFLAENPAFARAVAAAGLVFVGPAPEAMERLGDKERAKRLARELGVPVVPGVEGAPSELRRAAHALGLPLLVKAAAGGGGKGMRRVEDAAALDEALAAAAREAEAAFGDGRLLLERWIARPRHVEVQVLGDGRGRVVHLLERDCTLQRRHQKIIEEAPAPFLPEETRAGLHQAAVRLAAAAGYANAGTVEFLVEPDGRFWFIEMNTRLQVEHPVTEAVTGLDLVEWQLRLAAGEPLALRQEDIAARGHAIEARLYAEDPARGFLPSTGRLERFELDSSVRIETGVEEGDAITPHYDPMIAKLIASGDDREQARRRLTAALCRSRIAGIATNRQLLVRLLEAEPFRRMAIHTRWLDEELAAFTRPVDPKPLVPWAAFAALAARLARPAAPAWCEATSPWNLRDGFQPGLPARQHLTFAREGRVLALTALAEGDGVWRILRTDAAGEETLARGRPRLEGPRLLLEDDEGVVHTALAWVDEEAVEVDVAGERLRLAWFDGLVRAGDEAAGERLLTAPLPGRVVAVMAAAGARVRRGETLVVIEAMKMEQRLEAPHDGRIARVRVAPGEQVQEGQVLVEFAPAAEDET